MTWRETMVIKHGGEEGFKTYMRGLARKAGAAPHSKPTGFKARPDIVNEASRKGVEARVRAKHERNRL